MFNLGHVATTAKTKFKELATNGENMTVGEFKENLADATAGSLNRLKEWAEDNGGSLMNRFEDTSIDLQRLDSTPVGHKKIHGRSHKGFVISVNALREEIEETVLEALRENPGFKPVIVGHSLGAAVGSLLTMMWAKDPVLKETKCFACKCRKCFVCSNWVCSCTTLYSVS